MGGTSRSGPPQAASSRRRWSGAAGHQATLPALLRLTNETDSTHTNTREPCTAGQSAACTAKTTHSKHSQRHSAAAHGPVPSRPIAHKETHTAMRASAFSPRERREGTLKTMKPARWCTPGSWRNENAEALPQEQVGGHRFLGARLKFFQRPGASDFVGLVGAPPIVKKLDYRRSPRWPGSLPCGLIRLAYASA